MQLVDAYNKHKEKDGYELYMMLSILYSILSWGQFDKLPTFWPQQRRDKDEVGILGDSSIEVEYTRIRIRTLNSTFPQTPLCWPLSYPFIQLDFSI